MPLSEAKKKSNLKDDKENVGYQTVKVKEELLQEFRQAVQDNGDKVNTVLREAMETYIKEHKK